MAGAAAGTAGGAVHVGHAGQCRPTASYGVTDSHQAGTLEELLRVADLNLFHAKREGRNRIVLDSPTLPKTVPATRGADGNGATTDD
ncbi:MAG TPA: hypothetical protein VFH81_02405 [Actinomycetota bacterium]|nr:hypothetical protein [Actinomycetota bacterium]